MTNPKDSELQYFKDVLLHFSNSKWLYNNVVTRILIDETLKEFPNDWLTILQDLDNNGLNKLVSQYKVQV